MYSSLTAILVLPRSTSGIAPSVDPSSEDSEVPSSQDSTILGTVGIGAGGVSVLILVIILAIIGLGILGVW